MKYKYLGKEDPHNLAQVGPLKPGQIFTVTDKLGAELDKHAPETYVRVDKDESEEDSKGQNPPRTGTKPA
jgi:hypothetical protein